METLLDTNEIPIIDLKLTELNDNPSNLLIERLAKELDKALSEYGTALLINHGVSEEKQQLASEYFGRFCELSSDVKELFGRKSNHGYVRPGLERFDQAVNEIRHAFNFGTTNGDLFPNEYLPGWRDVIADLVKDMNRLQSLVLKSLAVALKVPIDFLLSNHAFISDAQQFGTTYRFLYYPPIPADDNEMSKNEKRTRCGAHSDYGTFTFLSQDSEGGLEVIIPGTNKWRRVGHLPGAILINGGEILDIWSENRYPALMHRVIIPEEDSVRNKGRHSRAFFVHSTPESLVGPIGLIREQMDGNRDETYKYITSQQFLENKFIATYGKPN